MVTDRVITLQAFQLKRKEIVILIILDKLMINPIGTIVTTINSYLMISQISTRSKESSLHQPVAQRIMCIVYCTIFYEIQF